jgi:hypothetical protein
VDRRDPRPQTAIRCHLRGSPHPAPGRGASQGLYTICWLRWRTEETKFPSIVESKRLLRLYLGILPHHRLGLSGVNLRKFTVNLRSVNISKSRKFTRVFY